jgi:hypothetical protein
MRKTIINPGTVRSELRPEYERMTPAPFAYQACAKLMTHRSYAQGLEGFAKTQLDS